MIRKILLMGAIVAMIFTGCVTDTSYEVAKNLYQGGKNIYKHSGVKNNKLESFGTYAEGYDDLRNTVRTTYEGNSNVGTSNQTQK